MDITVAKSVPDMLKINLVNKKKTMRLWRLLIVRFLGGGTQKMELHFLMTPMTFVGSVKLLIVYIGIVLEIVCLLL